MQRGVDEVWDEPEFAIIRKELVDEEPRTPDSPVAFRLDDPKLIPEGIAWDPRESVFLSAASPSARSSSRMERKASDFSGPYDKLDESWDSRLTAGARTSSRQHQWLRGEREDGAPQAVVRYDLKSGHLRDRLAAPEAMQLNDVAVAPDGTLYVQIP